MGRFAIPRMALQCTGSTENKRDITVVQDVPDYRCFPRFQRYNYLPSDILRGRGILPLKFGRTVLCGTKVGLGPNRMFRYKSCIWAHSALTAMYVTLSVSDVPVGTGISY